MITLVSLGCSRWVAAIRFGYLETPPVVLKPLRVDHDPRPHQVPSFHCSLERKGGCLAMPKSHPQPSSLPYLQWALNFDVQVFAMGFMPWGQLMTSRVCRQFMLAVS
ncbi:hypothetical protein B0H63DRAFT_276405 [Podospora didyma]|uniref:Uncharacterized protein n=1 Tax=Podospora didyma TaxID=330526 RepID=A0AAE0KFM0_9PEZI|nr:hypothetical protein B0H63DRAFT_276405 [Podospora didyma]